MRSVTTCKMLQSNLSDAFASRYGEPRCDTKIFLFCCQSADPREGRTRTRSTWPHLTQGEPQGTRSAQAHPQPTRNSGRCTALYPSNGGYTSQGLVQEDRKERLCNALRQVTPVGGPNRNRLFVTCTARNFRSQILAGKIGNLRRIGRLCLAAWLVTVVFPYGGTLN